MSLKRQAPDTWDEVPTTGQDHLQKKARLDTGSDLAIIDDPYFDMDEELGRFDEAAMLGILQDIDDQMDEPPLSVLRDFQSDSSTTQKFDPKLKFSPVKEGEDLAVIPNNDPPSDDISWDEVAYFKGLSQNDVSPCTSFLAPNTLQSSYRRNSSPSTAWTSSGTMDIAPDFSNMRLKPHKTFFHLSEMLEAKMSTFKYSHETVFELFARVIYSSRENFGHIQYFQFRDLFEESPPFLSGALSA